MISISNKTKIYLTFDAPTSDDGYRALTFYSLSWECINELIPFFIVHSSIFDYVLTCM